MIQILNCQEFSYRIEKCSLTNRHTPQPLTDQPRDYSHNIYLIKIRISF